MYDVIIIGSGFGGIASVDMLRKLDIDNYLLLERDEQLGGTWWRNSYPGAAVDVHSHLYSLSFEPYDWTRLFAHRDELLAYTNHVIGKLGIREKAKLNTNVTELRFNQNEQFWHVMTNNGIYKSKWVINATGILSQPNTPDLSGHDLFEGKSMHTNRWDHSYDYKGKNIAVIGTGASAIQTIPELAKVASHLYVMQRTPHWIIDRPDRILHSWERSLMRVKWINKLIRKSMYWSFESRMFGFRYSEKILNVLAGKRALKHLKKQIPNEEFRKKVTPDYAIGCKRILINNEYYPSLQLSNVSLMTKESGIDKITSTGIRTIDGQDLKLDLIVYATGFHAADNVIPFDVVGRDEVTLDEKWKDGAHAYLGTMVSHFPNLFLLAGPNTGIGHTSAIFMLETQLLYVAKMLQAAKTKHINSIEVKSEKEASYNKWIEHEMRHTIWQKGGCQSWYKREDGKNTTLYPTFTFKYRKACRKVSIDDHIVK